mmetsp:Transcript_27400/g.40171  ORF Transcript_27400/g.40171 Transcript_27400/m.40171 type:complete len:244 (-) Transcript_27400:372-1103(-)|eukprot:CAMPEP_0194060084 /NCGR_PEP_ID=MMETSP0009_2-20130614/70815_1 /TAXON_ID=210454 /ORGANISM="Grammatophora oceanica, Strain CCMP 410" /LENGTH=243 /DNA_ID=CAMNT_0038710885 /DNA_START=67 /DNA_END=798 /DNA_ORIENTATION=-
MNVIREIQRINEEELKQGLAGTSASWHAKYENSAWVYAGNLPHNLSEGDVICILSQCGEVEDIHLVRDEETGKSKGFCFLKYEDARSCVLAVDNLTGSTVAGRSIRVDHVEKYRLPKHLMEKEEEEIAARESGGAARTDAGHAYKDKELANEYNIGQGQDLFAGPVKTNNAKTGRSVDKEEAKQAKQKRKLERQEKRREREERREKREERRRTKRAKTMTAAEGDAYSRKDRKQSKNKKRKKS